MPDLPSHSPASPQEPARSRDDEKEDALLPISFVACVSDRAMLTANLLASPCLGPGSPHDVIAIGDAPSAAAGLNAGLERAEHELIVCVHQDVSLPNGWDRRVVEQFRRAEERFGPIGVAGIYGVGPVIERPGPGADEYPSHPVAAQSRQGSPSL